MYQVPVWTAAGKYCTDETLEILNSLIEPVFELYPKIRIARQRKNSPGVSKHNNWL